MEPRREQAIVGAFVLVVAAILIATIFALSGAFGRAATPYRTFVSFAGGLEPGATVRYAGGPKIGRVERVHIDPQDPRRLEISFSVRPDIPVKVDSVVKILSLSPLGENHLEITAGSAQAPRALPGAVLKSEPYVDFNAITSQVNAIGPQAQQLLTSLNERTTELKETIARVNDLLNTENRANLAGTLSNLRAMLEENRAKLKATLGNVETASAKMPALLDDVKKTLAQANQTIDHMDAVIGENRPDLRQSMAHLRQSLASAQSMTAQLDRTLSVNAENIDELLENLRHTSENLKVFTELIKTRPASLIRSSAPKDRRPGEP